MIQRGLHAYIRLPTNEEATEGAKRVQRRTGLPCIWGAIDGTHIAISAPEKHHRDFTNRKGWPSFVMQGVVDDRGRSVSWSLHKQWSVVVCVGHWHIITTPQFCGVQLMSNNNGCFTAMCLKTNVCCRIVFCLEPFCDASPQTCKKLSMFA